MKISKIILYDEPIVPEIRIKETREFIVETFQINVELQKNFFQTAGSKIHEEMETIQVSDLKRPFKRHKLSQDTECKDTQILYDGFELQNMVLRHVPITQDTLHIILTNKLVGTFDEEDFRYHARALIGANPTIISTAGIIEAPAKPRQFYLDQMTGVKDRLEKYRGEFLEYHDWRLHEVLQGYVLQSILYYETGEAFCDTKRCRLFNAHWQRDLIYSQIENKSFCNRHAEIIDSLRDTQNP